MHDVSLFRLYALRALYLLIVGGLGTVIWPILLHHPAQWPLMEGVETCMLVAFSLLCALGLRYPLQLLPVLLWELLWKAIWLTAVALPLWRAGRMDPMTWETTKACLGVLILPVVIPWRYVIDHYLTAPGARWRAARRADPPPLAP